MGRIVYGMMQSLDGYIAGVPGGPRLTAPSDDLHWVFNEQIRQTELFVYGRTMYEIMSYWETADASPDASPVDIDFARTWRSVPKVVVSTTLTSVGPNARLVATDVEPELRRLKSETSGLIDLTGSRLAASVGATGLIDEYWLYLIPVVLGGGKPFFQPGFTPALTLLGSTQLPDGVVQLRYQASR